MFLRAEKIAGAIFDLRFGEFGGCAANLANEKDSWEPSSWWSLIITIFWCVSTVISINKSILSVDELLSNAFTLRSWTLSGGSAKETSLRLLAAGLQGKSGWQKYRSALEWAWSSGSDPRKGHLLSNARRWPNTGGQPFFIEVDAAWKLLYIFIIGVVPQCVSFKPSVGETLRAAFFIRHDAVRHCPERLIPTLAIGSGTGQPH